MAESAAARELGVSRVPIREALFTLEREGLVEFSDTGRAYVKELSPHDFEELFVLRLALEPVAALVRDAFEHRGRARDEPRGSVLRGCVAHVRILVPVLRWPAGP